MSHWYVLTTLWPKTFCLCQHCLKKDTVKTRNLQHHAAAFLIAPNGRWGLHGDDQKLVVHTESLRKQKGIKRMFVPSGEQPRFCGYQHDRTLTKIERWRLIYRRDNRSVLEAYRSHSCSKPNGCKNRHHYHGQQNGQLWYTFHSSSGRKPAVHIQVPLCATQDTWH